MALQATLPTGPTRELERRLGGFSRPPEAIAETTRAIEAAVVAGPGWIDRGDFETFSETDLRHLYTLYDERFLDGLLGRALEAWDHPLALRISRRMTRAGGKTSWRGLRQPGERSYEIAVSAPLLFQTFSGVEREIRVAGLPCGNRLEALQRIFEHELVHLLEAVLWDESSCVRPRFQDLARRLFGHAGSTHELITRREIARERYGVKVGSRVRFRHGGQAYVGIVNRITKRATVLVEDRGGVPYSDGRHYTKFYVPLELLEPAGERR